MAIAVLPIQSPIHLPRRLFLTHPEPPPLPPPRSLSLSFTSLRLAAHRRSPLGDPVAAVKTEWLEPPCLLQGHLALRHDNHHSNLNSIRSKPISQYVLRQSFSSASESNKVIRHLLPLLQERRGPFCFRALAIAYAIAFAAPHPALL